MREKMDISDFNLVKWLQLHCQKKELESVGVIGIAKHLCGGATDLALTSFSLLEKASLKSKLNGVSMATCCHHRCDTKTYTNLSFIAEVFPALTIGEEVCPKAFDKLVRCSSWAVG